MKDAIVRVSSSAQSRLMTALPNSNPDQSRETPFPENGQQTPLCRVDKIPVRWPRQRSWITAHFEKWWAICRPPPKCRAARPCAAPVRGGSAQRWALFGRIHAEGDGRRTARESARAVGSACDTIRMLATSATVATTDHGRRAPERAAEPSRHIATIERACARRRRGCGFVIGACDDGARGASTISGETPFANNPESVYPVYPPY